MEHQMFTRRRVDIVGMLVHWLQIVPAEYCTELSDTMALQEQLVC